MPKTKNDSPVKRQRSDDSLAAVTAFSQAFCEVVKNTLSTLRLTGNLAVVNHLAMLLDAAARGNQKYQHTVTVPSVRLSLTHKHTLLEKKENDR
jgi:hypothetical protein